MSDRTRTLILELLLMHARYSQLEIREARALLSRDEFFRELSLIFELDDDLRRRTGRLGSKKSAPSKGRGSTSVASSRAQFVRKISDQKKTSTASLRAIAGVLGLSQSDGSREELVRSIGNSISSFDSKRFDQFLTEISARSADPNYLELAKFIIREEK